MIDNHVPWTLQFLFYPDEGKWKDTHQFRFQLQQPQLREATITNATVNLRQGRGFWKGGEIRKSKKRIYYVLQMMTFMIQLARADKVYDKVTNVI